MPGDINSNRCHGVYCEIHEPERFVAVEFAAFGGDLMLNWLMFKSLVDVVLNRTKNQFTSSRIIEVCRK